MIEGDVKTSRVWVNDRLLTPADSCKLRNHSPDGFSWGYAGSCPSQLALALLLVLTTKAFALEHYQQFKFDVIAKLQQSANFTMTTAHVRAWARDHGWKGETDK